MVFSSASFLFLFLPLVLTMYFLINKNFRNVFLLISSLFFYFWTETFHIKIMLIYIIINYLFGIIINTVRDSQKKWYLTSAISINLLLLISFKYANFIVDNLNQILNILHLKSIHLNPVYLPLGISFIAFHSISYIVDIYRKKAPPQKDIFKFSLYICFFPQLIAGPIIRYHDIANQLIKRVVTSHDFVIGIQRFIIGLAKKMLIANTLGAVADQIFSIPCHHLTFGVTWLGIICYSLQIYFDFSGYSDMAIGLGKMFGFHFLENFNYPYISKSIREFWRRWHISLSNWFRDYLYIPLGGNRVGASKTYLNLIVVFLLCGLWHGASWTFIFWGLYHGMFLIIERTKAGEWLENLPNPIQHTYAILTIIIGWVFFRADSLNYSFSYILAMFGFGQGNNNIYHADLYLNNFIVLALIIALIGATPCKNALSEMFSKFYIHLLQSNLIYNSVKFFYLVFIFIFSIMQIAISTYNPFIYFRF